MSTKSTTIYRLGTKTKRALLLGTTVVVLASAVMPVTSAQAFTPNVKKSTDHYFACLKLIFSNPAEHAKVCGPSQVPTDNASLFGTVIGAPVPTPPAVTPPPTVTPPPVVTPPPAPQPDPKCEQNHDHSSHSGPPRKDSWDNDKKHGFDDFDPKKDSWSPNPKHGNNDFGTKKKDDDEGPRRGQQQNQQNYGQQQNHQQNQHGQPSNGKGGKKG